MRKNIINILFFLIASVIISLNISSDAFGTIADNKFDSKYSRIRVVMDDNYPPYIFKDSKGNLQGILVDEWKLWERKTGIKVELYAMPWDKAQGEMKNGKYDVIDTLFENDERKKIYDFSKPYAKINVSIFFQNNISGITGVDSLSGFNVAVKKEDNSETYLKQHGINNLTSYDSYEDIIKAAKERKVSIFIMDTPPAQYFMYRENIQDKFNYSKPIYTGEFHRAVKKGNTELLATIEKGFSLISQNEYNQINNKWFGVNIIYAKFLKYLQYGILIIAIGFFILIGLNFALKIKVNGKTKQLMGVIDKLRESEEKFRNLAKLAPVAIMIHQDDLWVYTNYEGEKLFGYSSEELYQMYFWDLVEPKYRPLVIERERNRRAGEPVPTGYEIQMITKDGSVKWVYINCGIIKFNGKPAVLISISDITELKQMSKEIFDEKERFKMTLTSIGDGVISTDEKGNIKLMNKVAERLTGWNREKAFGKPFEEIFNIVNEITGEKCESPIQKVINSSKIVELPSHTMLISKSGAEIPIENSAAPIKDESGSINGVVLVFKDVTEEREKQKEILYLSYHDQLTGLYNRRFYEEELKRLDTKLNLPLTVVMADVNGLKLINDSLGHAIGDKLLKKVAEVLLQGCGTDGIVARLGGDEFIILLPKTDDFETEQIVKRITALASKEKVDSFDISISFGYETKKNEEEEIQEILKKSEDYMYRKKLMGRQSVRGKTIDAIITTLHEKNKREEQHSHRVSSLCKSMGEALNLSEGEIEELKTVGLLHDIGKIAIDENILNKPGRLTDVERKEIMGHPEIGYRILSTVNDMTDIAGFVLCHHERWDGKGYPKGLKGEEIPFVSRIIAITDAYDAMTSERSYRSALPEEVALNELQINAGIQFDPELVKVFIEKVLHIHQT